ncbi:transcriptional regulator, AraC family [Allomuricauda ruestringensis DSM 13258]|uniref:Transcriptional regulator, AraC family n=1 Tax=Allomuricauda ruestringensis (strain DSM 13258 / CIP 107369 / LMG 19739 / B1) TaxID=886377 RepID=G2PLI1_ALLRU|nr:AraC family transcriptional regulator [Allomuricauda ruestringensis]AEM70013.1 transcriptional regulator, AraC family [Allomuricauda ruestringensis DSM 13258]
MENFETILDQIPIRHDLASHIMLLGIVQGFFLALVIFLRAKRKSAINLFGWSLLIQCLVFLDVYLCYTGLIKHIIRLNDSTEFLVLLITPTLYFFLYTLLERKPITLKKHWPHFVLPVLYAVSQVNYYLGPIEVKLNAYLGAYHRDLGFVDIPGNMNYSYHFIKDQFRWLVLFSFAFYLVLSLLLVIKTRKRGWTSPKNIKVDKYIFSRNTVAFFMVLMLTLLFIFLNYEDDGGDHFIGIVQTVTIFITSFFILSESRFFEKSWIADKYETLASNSIKFETIESFISETHYYSHQNISLKKVAEELGTNSNIVSKLINSETGTNFNDYINQKRIALAQQRLLDDAFKQLTVEAIGQSVGFKSKSAFYNAFKKHAGQSPSAFMKQKGV